MSDGHWIESVLGMLGSVSKLPSINLAFIGNIFKPKIVVVVYGTQQVIIHLSSAHQGSQTTTKICQATPYRQYRHEIDSQRGRKLGGGGLGVRCLSYKTSVMTMKRQFTTIPGTIR